MTAHKEQILEEFKKEFHKRYTRASSFLPAFDFERLLSKALDKTQQATIGEIEKILLEAENITQKELAKKYKTYNYDANEGLLALKYTIEKLLDKLKKG